MKKFNFPIRFQKGGVRFFSHDKQKYRWTHYENKDIHGKPLSPLSNEQQKHKELDTNDFSTVMEFSYFIFLVFNKMLNVFLKNRIAPLGTAEVSLGKYVGISNRIVLNNGMKHEVHPMGTVVEGFF